ncbi:MAG: PQQ-binding-like beta-propeller repeat protein [Bacteroidales bacterium]
MNFRIFPFTFSFLLIMLIFCASPRAARGQWPQFRGPAGSGILDFAGSPVEWDLSTGKGVQWNVAVPGLAHSCPVIWGDKVFVTTAVSSSARDSLKIGLYGDINMADDHSPQQFRVLCFNRKNGELLWEKSAWEGVPLERRHTKSTYANPTPAVDGQHLLAFFGSHGLYCYDLDGNLLWKKDLGILATGPYTDPGVEWGYASSPVIHQGKVVIQADLLGDSFLNLLDIRNGEEIWRVNRESISSWGTPAVFELNGRTLIVLNGYPYMNAYDFNTGEEVWRIGNVGDAPAPTAIYADGLIYLNSAHGKWSPIIAIRPDAQGDLTLPDTLDRSEGVAWLIRRGGAYMASLLAYGQNLYNLQISGLLTVLDPQTGEVRYRHNFGKPFSASPVASDGNIYLTAESGEVFVLRDGPQLELIRENHLNDNCMATPAISEGMIIWRTQHRLIAIGK